MQSSTPISRIMKPSASSRRATSRRSSDARCSHSCAFLPSTFACCTSRSISGLMETRAETFTVPARMPATKVIASRWAPAAWSSRVSRGLADYIAQPTSGLLCALVTSTSPPPPFSWHLLKLLAEDASSAFGDFCVTPIVLPVSRRRRQCGSSARLRDSRGRELSQYPAPFLRAARFFTKEMKPP